MILHQSRHACAGLLSLIVALAGLTGCSEQSCEPSCETPEDIEVDLDGDGYLADDCAPLDFATHPGAVEVCDGIDNDCSGAIDDGAVDATTWYADGDGDGYGIADQTTSACAAPLGFASVSGDCNDADDRIHPDAAEADCADPIDYNCDGSVGFQDADGDTVAACLDCNDADPNRSPLLTDACDGIDNNCDLAIDNGTTGDGAYLRGQLYPSIQVAIDAAVDGDTVAICRGTYASNLDVQLKGITLTSLTGVAADVELVGGLIVKDAPTKTTRISKLTFRTTTTTALRASNSPVVVEDSRFENNTGVDGAAISAGVTGSNKLSLRVKGSEFIGNTASDAGAAIAASTTRGGGHVTIVDSRFVDNRTLGGVGHGAVAIAGCGSPCGSSTADSVTIDNCTFEGSSTTQQGGAVRVAIHGEVTISDSTFETNTADQGGAIAILPLGVAGPNQLLNGTVVKVNGSVFEGNAASAGPAIFFPSASSYSRLELDACTVAGNEAAPGSAAIDARSLAGNDSGDLSFLSDNTTWGGEGDATTNNLPLDLLINCGSMTDVTSDVSCF